MRRLIHSLITIAAVLTSFVAGAGESAAVLVKAKPGVKTVLTKAPCIDPIIANAVGTVSVEAEGEQMAVYITLPPERRDGFELQVKTGPKPVADASCAPDTTLKIQVSVDTVPDVSMDSVQKAFVVLMAAFVLALLLESAFALLFNWRLFQEFFVGRAWRTPIMFAISLVIVRRFDLDLLEQVFAAYRGGQQPDGGWLSSILTAMIISGGSVGVNSIMVGLGFRSPIPKAEAEANKIKLDSDEAYVSLDIRDPERGRKLSIEMLQTIGTGEHYPTLAVVGGNNGGRLKAILFPNRSRVPRSGGMRVQARGKCYRFVIRDLATGKYYNIDGEPIDSIDKATEFCFAPKAFVDFVVDMH
jgi:hypothetical protein